MEDITGKTVRLADYAPPGFLLDEVGLDFDLNEEYTVVRAVLHMRRNPLAGDRDGSLFLHGTGLTLCSLKIDGSRPDRRAYRQETDGLRIFHVPDRFVIETEVRIYPRDNTALEGLYCSGGMYCTQCEPEGFRRITFFPDRPDVMTTFRTRIEADQTRYPVLLSNGNFIGQETLPGGRHRVIWHDPFPKPGYLFALVAGDLAVEEDSFTTCSGREVALRVYLEKHNLGRGGHALRALKKAMRWDEEVFGLEYDLDLYMIVAVDDFNMGAMENKGLNIFNSKYVLADVDTATDSDFQAIEEVVAHEYFHNWTGNRVTCRDWFQLSLKEGLTVFRDQEFSADLVAKSLKRIHDVKMLRTVQFAEDAGPLAHPVRPESYQEINNFYTVTVYEKGAEIVRMLRNLLGAEGFQKGLSLYFQRFDGQAVTIEDFLCAMEDACSLDLTQFRLWYSQAGTPHVQVTENYDAKSHAYSMTFRQECPTTPGQVDKQPFHIPVSMGLLDRDGREMPLCLNEDALATPPTTTVLSLTAEEQVFRFSNVRCHPVPSLLRGFSAPVRLGFDYSDEDLRFLMVHDRDAFNRWDACQQLATRVILRAIDRMRSGEDFQPDPVLSDAYAGVLEQSATDRGLAAQMLMLPTENYLADQRSLIDIEHICLARHKVRETLGLRLRDLWQAAWESCRDDATDSYAITPDQIGLRSLQNLCLEYLCVSRDVDFTETLADLFTKAGNMTDRLALVAILAEKETAAGEKVLKDFYRQARPIPLVLDKWFAVQAAAKHPAIVDRVKALTSHRDFNLRNPNRVRALLHTFARGNLYGFHAGDGRGYDLVAEHVIKLDKLNPQVSASLAGAFSQWGRFVGHRRTMMKEQLERIAAVKGISVDLHEIVQRSLGGTGGAF